MNTGKRNTTSKIKLQPLEKGDKARIAKEIKDKKMLVNNEKYLNGVLNFDVKVTQAPKKTIKKNNTSTNVSVKKETISSNTTISSVKSTTANDEPVLKKIERLYTETYEAMTKNKTSIDKDLSLANLKEEIIFLKQKNELLKLKSKFYEIIFYSLKNTVEQSPNISPSELQSKIVNIFTQNNQYYYDKISFLGSKKKAMFSFDDNDEDERLLNEKSLKSIQEIENKIELCLTVINDNTTSQNQIKEKLVSLSKEILSFYFYSENLFYEFKHKSKFWLCKSEDFMKKEIATRKKKIEKEFNDVLDPMMNKVMNKKAKSDLSNFLISTCNFYENLNGLLLSENYSLKKTNSDDITAMSKRNDNIIKDVNEYISQSENGFNKLHDLINFIDTNKTNKNAEKIFLSLFNTDKEVYTSLIQSYDKVKMIFN